MLLVYLSRPIYTGDFDLRMYYIICAKLCKSIIFSLDNMRQNEKNRPCKRVLTRAKQLRVLQLMPRRLDLEKKNVC